MGKFKTLSSEIAHKNPWFQVKKDDIVRPDGNSGEYYVVQISPNVTVVAADKNQQIYLIEMFRYPTKVVSLETVSGGTDGEDPLVAARRELQEETGLVAEKWTHLGRLQMANGILDQWGDFYLAELLTQTSHHEQAAEGITAVKKVPIEKALKMIAAGKINDLPTTNAIMLAALKLGHSLG